MESPCAMYHRVIKVECTIAELAEASRVHVAEAIQYRRFDLAS